MTQQRANILNKFYAPPTLLYLPPSLPLLSFFPLSLPLPSSPLSSFFFFSSLPPFLPLSPFTLPLSSLSLLSLFSLSLLSLFSLSLLSLLFPSPLSFSSLLSFLSPLFF